MVNGISNKDAGTATYQNVYNLFLEGQFDKAKDAKKAADSTLGKSYWTPQLLYIEAIYYVKQQEDSIAINRLQSLSTAFPKSPLAEKAITMIDVLKRRKQIESHAAGTALEGQAAGGFGAHGGLFWGRLVVELYS